MTTPKQRSAALQIIIAIAECIRELGEVPSGTVYAPLMGRINYSAYETIIGTLKNAKLITESPAHLLKWIGPLARERQNTDPIRGQDGCASDPVVKGLRA